MTDGWSLYNPVFIHFGRGCRCLLVERAAGQSILIVTTARGRRQIESDSTLAALADSSRITWLDSIKQNPGVNELQVAASELESARFDSIVGFGGGSALDSAKAIALALSEEGRSCTLKELLSNPSLYETTQTPPLVAVPTTAGTGSEVTPFATVWNHHEHTKHSLEGPALFPCTALIDPDLSDSVPQEVTHHTGLDAINQAVESVWNKNASPVTIAYATEALRLGFDALPRLATGDGGPFEREQMAACSLLAGLAISQTRTALCHSISYPITARFGVPHGLACAFTMPAVLRLNLGVDDGRFQRLERDLGFGDLQQSFDDLNRCLGVARLLKDYVPDLDSLLDLTSEMFAPDRASNTLASVDRDVIAKVLRTAWEDDPEERTIPRDG